MHKNTMKTTTKTTTKTATTTVYDNARDNWDAVYYARLIAEGAGDDIKRIAADHAACNGRRVAKAGS